MKSKNILDEKLICNEYTETEIGVEAMALKYHVGKKKIKEILTRNGVEIKKRGGQQLKEVFVVSNWKVEKYPDVEGKKYVAVDKKTGFSTFDVNNRGGVLTTYINKTYSIKIPTLYDRRMYYMRTGNYWWEQWFTIESIDKSETKKCPYCEWETVDLENKSGMFATHLLKEHNLKVEEHIEKHPEDLDYFSKFAAKKERVKKLSKEGNYVICPLCGERFEKLTKAHMENIHHIKWETFKEKNPDIVIMSESAIKQTRIAQHNSNLVVSKNRYISKYEREIQEYLQKYGIVFEHNRQILDGKEIDILIPDKKIGIEFDGLKFHTEFFGKKSHTYHLDKTETCNRHGYGLIHIFEDEYVNKQELVYAKLSHIVGIDEEKEKINARECEIREILKHEAEQFLDRYHIQGYSRSTIYYGCFHEGRLIAVMSFKNGNVKSKDWELTRFASDYHYVCRGVGGKLFKRFIKDINPERVISFADRRWTVDVHTNLYTKLGFIIDKIGRPDYRYYNERVDRYKRVHKMSFVKDKLIKKYGFPKEMTEWEMARELGYDRIWDCGLVKYVWKRK